MQTKTRSRVSKRARPSGSRVLITGGGGFIGSHVADLFATQGWEVVVLGRTFTALAARDFAANGITVVQGCVGDRALLERIFETGIDGVVHMASSSVPNTSNADKMLDVRSNLVESLELLECCVKHKVAKVVLASSGGTVYGIPTQLPIVEAHPTNPICSYGIVKLAQEKYLDLYQRLHGLNYVALRIANPYGPRQDPQAKQGVISVFAAKMLQQQPISVWGDGEVIRDFVHVRDIARLFHLAMTSSEQGVFNAGSGVGVSINELIGMMSLELFVTPNVLRLGARACDVPVTVLDCSKARQAFGWVPQIGMRQGIAEVGAWLKSEVLPPMPSQIHLQQATGVHQGVGMPGAVLAQMI